MSWDVVWTEPAIDDLSRLDNRTANRIIDAVDRLAAERAGDVQRLQGIRPPEWRLRVGDWRVRFVFAYSANAIAVLAVAPRGRAYRS